MSQCLSITHYSRCGNTSLCFQSQFHLLLTNFWFNFWVPSNTLFVKASLPISFLPAQSVPTCPQTYLWTKSSLPSTTLLVNSICEPVPAFHLLESLLVKLEPTATCLKSLDLTTTIWPPTFNPFTHFKPSTRSPRALHLSKECRLRCFTVVYPDMVSFSTLE